MGDLKDIKKQDSIVQKIKGLNLFGKKEEQEKVDETVVTNPVTDNKVYTNEEVYSNYLKVSYKMLDDIKLSNSYDDLQLYALKADSFNKISTNVLQGIRDSYKELNRDKEYLLKMEELKIKKMHEFNETLKAAKGNKEFGQTIMQSAIQYLNGSVEDDVKYISTTDTEESME